MFNLPQLGVRTSTVVCSLLTALAFSSYAGEKDVIINEIMYHPPLDMEELQYVEILNRGNTPIDLGDWSFTKGLKYVFPKRTRINPDEYLVICRDTNMFTGNYGSQVRLL